MNNNGKSKAEAERLVLNAYPKAMMIRTSAFFSPWDKHNFINQVIETLSLNNEFAVADDIFISPTYVPDLVNVSLDLLIDKEKGIWHLTNKGKILTFPYLTVLILTVYLPSAGVIKTPMVVLFLSIFTICILLLIRLFCGSNN